MCWGSAASLRTVVARSALPLLVLMLNGSALGCDPVLETGHETLIQLDEPGLVIAPGGSGRVTVNVLDRRSYGADIILSAPFLPPGFTASFAPEKVDGATSTLTVAADIETPEGDYDLLIHAEEPESGDGESASDEETLIVTVATDPDAVPAPDFRLDIRGDTHVTDPGSTTLIVEVRPLERFTGWVRFSVSGLTNDFHIESLDDIRIEGGTSPKRRYARLVFDPVGDVPETLRMTITATGPATSHSVSKRLVITYTAPPTQPGTGPTAPGS